MAGSARLGPAEVDELVQLYQRASTHLSHARTQRADPTLVTRLTRLVADARGVLYGTRSRSLAGFVRFFTTSFPAAVWHARRFVVVSALLLFVPAILMGSWLARSDAALEASAPDALREAYVEEDFEAYYSSAPASQFATEVTVNNIQVGFLAFAFGILLCVPTAFVLAINGANLGWAAGLFAAVGQQPKFYGLILPHGLLELSAIVVAGAAGLAVGWAIVDPGDRPRTEALAEQGRRSAVIALGLAARVRRGRHDRGLRHPQRPPHVGARRHRHRRLPRLLDLRHRPRPPRRVGGLHRSLRRARAAPARNEPARAADRRELRWSTVCLAWRPQVCAEATPLARLRYTGCAERPRQGRSLSPTHTVRPSASVTRLADRATTLQAASGLELEVGVGEPAGRAGRGARR